MPRALLHFNLISELLERRPLFFILSYFPFWLGYSCIFTMLLVEHFLPVKSLALITFYRSCVFYPYYCLNKVSLPYFIKKDVRLSNLPELLSAKWWNQVFVSCRSCFSSWVLLMPHLCSVLCNLCCVSAASFISLHFHTVLLWHT